MRPHRVVAGERLILLIHLPRILVVGTAIMHTKQQTLTRSILHQRQRLSLAARNGDTAAVPVVIQVVERVLAQFKPAIAKRFRIAQRKTELQQVHATHAHVVQAHKQLLHLGKRAGNHRHLNHHIGQRRNGGLDSPKHGRIGTRDILRLDAKSHLIKSRISQRIQARIIQQVTARV